AARLLTLHLSAFASVLALLTIANDKARAGGIKPSATIGDTNLRTTPRADGAIVARIPKGATVDVGDCRNGWGRGAWNGQNGYAIARNLCTASALRWPNAPVAALQGGDYGQWQTARKIDLAGGRDESNTEHRLVLEVGVAGEWPLNGDRPNSGGMIAAEIEPIAGWLELEFGLSTLGSTGHTVLSGDVLFKKPFRLSPTVEFMVGAGPSLSRTLNGPEQGNARSVEFALDWMFWPTRNIGWFIEPTW